MRAPCLRLLAQFLDAIGDAGFRLSARCFVLRERVAPTPSQLEPETADRILAGVMARIAAEPLAAPPALVTPRFQPSANDRAAASIAQDIQKTVYFVEDSRGVFVAVANQRGRA